LIKIAKNTPDLLFTNWNEITDIICKPRVDSHDDYGESCQNNIHNMYTDTGIGLDFPPFPSHLANK
jgi:hypothetical protein